MSPHLESGTAPRRIHWKCWELVSSSLQPLMNNITLFWNSTMCGVSYPLSIEWQSCYLQNAWVKKNQISSHLAAVVIGTRVCSVVKLPLTIVTSHLEQWEVVDTAVDSYGYIIVTPAPRAKQTWHTKLNVIHSNSLGPNTSRVLHMNWKHGYQTQQVS